MPKYNIKDYQTLANIMVENDLERDNDFIEYENMIHGIWDLPDGLPAWVGASVNTMGHDAVFAPTRILSSLEPDFTFYPLAGDLENRERANMIERAIKWQFWGARKRRHSSIITEIVQSCIMYSAVAVELVDLDYQRKLRKAFKMPTSRFDRIRRYGRFAFNLYNPRFIHAEYSQYGIERRLKKVVKSAYEIWSEYGEVADAIKKDALSKEGTVYYMLYDLMDNEEQVVWLEPHTGSSHKATSESKDAVVLIPPTPHKMEFIPWSIRCGGSGLETEEKYKYHSILASVLWFKQWDKINMIDSLTSSKAMATAGAPDIIEEGPIPQSTTKIDLDTPFVTAKATPGNTTKQLNPPQIDPRLAEVSADIRAQVMKSTVPGVLQNADIPSGMAYATYNLQLQNALSVVKPYQEMAERTLSDLCELMMLSVKYSKIDLRAYNWDKKNIETFGEEYIIEADTINEDGLYFDVKLKADVPSDEMVKLQASIQAVQGLGMAKEDALERFGVSDPITTINKRYEETLLENEINLIMTQKQGDQQMAMQQQAAEQQMAMQQAMANANPQGIPGAEGMNPAEGSASPMTVNPNATREMQTNKTRSGQQAMRGI